MKEILSQIWNLPWYKVAVIAFTDDVLLIIKLWWLWLLLAAVWVLLYKYAPFITGGD